MSGTDVAATLLMRVGTERAVTDLANLTASLREFKAVLKDFNSQKAANPFSGIGKEAEQALKTNTAGLLREAEETGGRASKKLVASFSVGLDNGLKVALKGAGTETAKLVSEVGARADKLMSDLKANGIQTADSVKRAAKEAAQASKVAFQTIGPDRSTLDEHLKRHEALNKARRELEQRNNRLIEADTKSHLDTINRMREANIARMKAEALGTSVNLTGQRAVQLQSIKEGLAFGPTREDRSRLMSIQAMEAWKAEKKAAEEAGHATVSHGQKTKEASVHTINHTKALNDAHSAARGLASGFGALWLTWGNLGPLLAGAALSNAFVQATKSGAEFAYQLTFVKALGDESAEAVAHVGQRALEMSKNSLFGPVELANGLRMLAQAGLDAESALLALPTVLELATVGEMTMAEAGVTLAGVMNAFSLHVEDMSHVGDVFAKAAAESQTSVQAMTNAMKTASVVGEQYGASMEDTATALTLLAKVNITGTAAGTSLRNMLKELYTPMDGVAKVMKQIGLTASDELGNLRPFSDVIYDLRGRLEQFNKASQVKILQALFGERGAKEAVAMLSQTREEWDELNRSISQSQGFISKVSAELEATTKGTMAQAINTLKVNLVGAFQESEGEIGKLAASLRNLFDSEGFRTGLQVLVKAMAEVTVIAVKLAPALAALAVGYVGLKAATLAVSGVVALTAALTAYNGIVGPGITLTSRFTAALFALQGAEAATRTVTLLSAATGLLLHPLTLAIAALGGLYVAYRYAGSEEARQAVQQADDFAEAIQRVADKSTEALRALREYNAERDRGVNPKVDVARREIEVQRENLRKLQQKVLVDEGEIPDTDGRWKGKNRLNPFNVVGIEKDKKAIEEAERKLRQAEINLMIIEGNDEMLRLERSKESVRRQLEEQERMKSLKTGTKEFEKETRGGFDRDRELSEDAKAAILRFQQTEKLARQEVEYADWVADEKLRIHSIGETEYAALRKQNLDQYRLQVLEAEAQLNLEVGLLQDKADKESTRKRMQNELDRANNAVDARAESMKIDQRKRVEKVKFGAEELANKIRDEEIPALHTKFQLERDEVELRKQMDSMSSIEIEVLEAKTKVTNEYNTRISAVNAELKVLNDLQLGNTEQSMRLRQEAEALAKARDAEAQATGRVVREEAERQRLFQTGWNKSMQAYKDSAENNAQHAADIFSATTRGMEDALKQFFKTGKIGWRDYLTLVSDVILEISAKMITAQLMQSATNSMGGMNLGSLFGLFSGGSGSSMGGSPYTGGADAVNGLDLGWSMAARGATFTGGVSQFSRGGAFTNAVFSSPTMFRFANGGRFSLGVMGEAGDEAVMPLARDAAGELGVKVKGGGGMVKVVNNFTVQGTTDKRSQSQIAAAAYAGVVRASRRNS